MTGVRSIEAVAAGLTAAFAVGAQDQLVPLLAPDVRWGGDEDTEQTCRGPAQVLAWYQWLQVQGVRVQVLGTEIRGDAVVLRIAVQWPEGWELRNFAGRQGLRSSGSVTAWWSTSATTSTTTTSPTPRCSEGSLSVRCAVFGRQGRGWHAALRASRRRVVSGMGRGPAGVS